MRDEFVSRAAYAIRSPVNIILGYSELIAQRLLALGDDSQQPYIDGIRRSGRQILSAISRILDYASIEQGTLRISPERIHLAGLLEKLAQDYRVLAVSKKLGLICEIEEPGAGVECDSYCLTAALSNLIDNAIKFTHRGGVVVKLHRDGQGLLCVEVRDTGVGFDPRALERGAQAGANPGYQQSGLGLILTRKYLELIGASMAIASSPGKGSAFTVTFPARLEVRWQPSCHNGEPVSPHEAAAPAAPANAHAARPVVLVVEDQADQALFMRTLLQRSFDVVVAADAAEALHRLTAMRESPALIVMDIGLGGGEDGLTLTRRIRADRRWRQVPIVVTSAHAFEHDRERALEAGCSAYLTKPIDRGELIATIGRLTK